MALELKTPPAQEPLTLAETKAYLKITGAAEDAWINGAIPAVRELCEAYTRRALVLQTWTWWLDGFPLRSGIDSGSGAYALAPVRSGLCEQELEVPRPPLQSVAHLKTYDAADTATTFDASRYLLDTAAQPGRIVLRQNQSWPVGLRRARGVEVEFVAGYGGAGTDAPQSLRQGMLLWIRLWYADKSWLFDSGAQTPGLAEFNRLEIPAPIRALWAPYRLESLSRSCS